MGLKIEHEESLKAAFENGINVFTGAAFSTLASDCTGKSLPTGKDLAIELSDRFLEYKIEDLTQISTILKSKCEEDFNQYLTERFSVRSFDERYYYLNKLNIHSYFTTNIDDLIPQIVDKHSTSFLNNQREEGVVPGDKVINFLPLHGYVKNNDKKYDFTLTEISTTAQNNPRVWQVLMRAVEERPTIFLGYGFRDASTLGTLYSKHTFQNEVKEKWILLYQPTPANIDFYKSLNFSIIEGSIEDFLDYIPKLAPTRRKKDYDFNTIVALLRENLVPSDLKGLAIRPINHYFKGDIPYWADILSKNIYETSHVQDILNSINSNSRHTLIVGGPLCGKSTATMQAIVRYAQPNIPKLFFSHLTISRAQYYKKIIGSSAALIFVEGFTDDVDAFLLLASAPNVKMVGVDRSHMYGTVSDLFNPKHFNIINVTEISEQDLTHVFRSLPNTIRNNTLRLEKKKNNYKADTIFEFVSKNINSPTISQRYKEMLDQAEYNQKRFLVLCAYMHFCRVPLSIEVALSFFNYGADYYDLLSLKHELDDLLSDLNGKDYEDMDYYYPRSQHVAESVLKHVQKSIVREVVENVLENVPKYQIPNYKTFRRYAYDSKFISTYFTKMEQGRKIYLKAYELDDHNPYVLQQGALYLADKGEYEEAFTWIDRAKTRSGNKHFSIRNTHAIILFEANIKRTPLEQRPLDESMGILKQCYADDRRKYFHALVFAQQAMDYYQRLPNEKTMGYLVMAKKWIKEVREHEQWSWDIKNTLDRLTEFIDSISK